MKFVHLSDLHLGKRVNEFSMIEDQNYILNEILTIIDQENADGVFIAGDVYDKAVPAAEAVQLFDWFLNELAKRDLYIFLISGNHDSAERLAFGRELMKEKKVFLSPIFTQIPSPIVVEDTYGELNVYLLPFIKPIHVRRVLNEREEIHSYDEAVGAVVEAMSIDAEKRNVILTHQFVTGAVRSESEELSVGGIDNVNASRFAVFDYVALGHIHGPQKMSEEKIRYCGSPLKYSFSESEHQKSVTVVEFQEKGKVMIHTVGLTPLRDLCEIKGTYEEVASKSFYEQLKCDDYMHVTLTDEEDIPDVLNKLRVIYPNIMKLDYDNKRTRRNQTIEEAKHIKQKTPLELFDELYELQNNQNLSEEQQEFLQLLIEEIWEES